MAEIREVVGDFAAALPMIGGNGVARRRGSVDDGDRTGGGRDAGGAAGNDDHAIDATLDQTVDRFGLGGDIAAGIRDQHAVTRSRGGEFDRLSDLREQRIGDIG